jgi:hypothetical protein
MNTNNSMNGINTSILDILKAATMHISLWQWEMHMIAKHGLDWRYKDSWQPN